MGQYNQQQNNNKPKNMPLAKEGDVAVFSTQTRDGATIFRISTGNKLADGTAEVVTLFATQKIGKHEVELEAKDALDLYLDRDVTYTVPSQERGKMEKLIFLKQRIVRETKDSITKAGEAKTFINNKLFITSARFLRNSEGAILGWRFYIPAETPIEDGRVVKVFSLHGKDKNYRIPSATDAYKLITNRSLNLSDGVKLEVTQLDEDEYKGSISFIAKVNVIGENVQRNRGENQSTIRHPSTSRQGDEGHGRGETGKPKTEFCSVKRPEVPVRRVVANSHSVAP